MNLLNAVITQEMDIVSYADIYTALSEDRPYRSGMAPDRIIQILRDEYLSKHGEPVFQIILNNLEEIDAICKSSVQDGISRFNFYQKLAAEQEQKIKHDVVE